MASSTFDKSKLDQKLAGLTPSSDCLDLGEFGLGDEGVIAVCAALRKINAVGLNALWLNGNKISDAGAKALAEALKHCPNLTDLRLYGNKISDAGAKALAEALKHCPNLTHLYLTLDPRKVNWKGMGLEMPAEVLAAASVDGDGDCNWAPMLKKLREIEATATPPAAAAAAAQEQGGGEELRQLLRAQDLERLAEPLKEEGFERLEDLRGLGETDVEALCKEVLKLRFKDTLSFKKVLAQAKATATPPAAAAAAQATASPPAAAAADQEEVKFAARELIMGDAVVSATGLKSLVGLGNTTVLTKGLDRGWDAVEEEWLSTGDENDAANYQYIRHGRGRNESDMPPLVKEQIQRGYYHGGSIAESDFDRGHDGWTLADFVAHEHARTAKLIDKEVFALRGYTSGSFPRFNKPLRLGLTPHPFKMTLYYLDEALRKLRAVEATKDRAAYMAVKELYRGMKDMNLDADKFQMYGGTEMACMSTTATKAVALKYASSTVPLLFRYKTRGNSRGVSIQFLSMFPGEDEYLYPPLTLLASDGPPVTEDGVTVFDVSPQFS